MSLPMEVHPLFKAVLQDDRFVQRLEQVHDLGECIVAACRTAPGVWDVWGVRSMDGCPVPPDNIELRALFEGHHDSSRIRVIFMGDLGKLINYVTLIRGEN